MRPQSKGPRGRRQTARGTRESRPDLRPYSFGSVIPICAWYFPALSL